MQKYQIHTRFINICIAIFSMIAGYFVVHEHGPRQAMANDDKIFASQTCVPIDPDFGGIGDADIRVDEIEQITQLDYQLFICPLTRDRVTGVLDDVWVRLNNENSDEDTPPICCVFSVSLGTSMQDYECQTAPDIETIMSLHFTLDDFEEYDHGHYVVTCDLGLEDQLISIRTSED